MTATSDAAAQAAIGAAARELKLPTVRDEAVRLAEIAARDHASYLAYLAEVLAAELDDRSARRRARRIADARFPRLKRLDDFNTDAVPASMMPAGRWPWRLASGPFIRSPVQISLTVSAWNRPKACGKAPPDHQARFRAANKRWMARSESAQPGRAARIRRTCARAWSGCLIFRSTASLTKSAGTSASIQPGRKALIHRSITRSDNRRQPAGALVCSRTASSRTDLASLPERSAQDPSSARSAPTATTRSSAPSGGGRWPHGPLLPSSASLKMPVMSRNPRPWPTWTRLRRRNGGCREQDRVGPNGRHRQGQPQRLRSGARHLSRHRGQLWEPAAQAGGHRSDRTATTAPSTPSRPASHGRPLPVLSRMPPPASSCTPLRHTAAGTTNQQAAVHASSRRGGTCPLGLELLRAPGALSPLGAVPSSTGPGPRRSTAAQPARRQAGLDTSRRTYGDGVRQHPHLGPILPPTPVPQVALIHCGLLVVLLRLVQVNLAVPLLVGSLNRALLGMLVPSV
jgi:hypothetical protein